MKSLRWVTAGLCAIAAAGLGAALAHPTSSYTSNMMTYDQTQCLARAQQAMAAEGWVSRASGGPSGQIGLLGHKEPSSAYILCLPGSNAPLPAGAPPAGGTNVVVFVTSTAPNAAIPAEEAARLQQRMIAP